MTKDTLNISDIRRRLGQSEGPAFWRSLEELAETKEFRASVEREFPSWASQWKDSDGVSRRHLLKIMGASLALMGLNGCFYKRPQGKLVPYPQAPEEIIPGRPIFFATAMPFCGYARGVLALSREGRPIKIEGNPDHPASLGGTDVFMQASVLDLYDPDRSRNVRLAGEISRWSEFQDALAARLAAGKGNASSVRILTATVTSPTFQNQMREFLTQYPGAIWHTYEPTQSDGGNPFAGGADTIYDFRPARVILSIGDDFMFSNPGSPRYARHFTDGRRVREDSKKMNRLYVVESNLSLTGSMADHRLPLSPLHIHSFVTALAQKCGLPFAESPQLPPDVQRWVDAVADDLMHPTDAGPTLVLAGQNQTAAVRATVHQINQKLGNIGKTVFYIDPVAPRNTQSLKALAADMMDHKVDTLLMLGVNPAYNAPADVPMAEALTAMTKRGDFTATLASHYDETSYLCQWHLPHTHYLECWGDVRAFDGTASIIQPLIAPLYGARSEWELMDLALGRPEREGLEIIQDHWKAHAGSGDFEQWWIHSLQKGVIEGTASPHRAAPTLQNGLTNQTTTRSGGGVEIVFEPDASAWSGEFANNAWLQEIPRPFTKLTWDNAIGINLRMAEKWAGKGREMLKDGDIVRIDYRGKSLEAPVMLIPGQADDVATLYLGYGRRRGGQVMLDEGRPRGYDAYSLRRSDHPWSDAGATITPTGNFQFLAITRNHHAMSIHKDVPGVKPTLKPNVIADTGDSDMNLEVENRKIVRVATLAEFQADSNAIKHLDPETEKKPLLSLYPGWDYEHGLQWAMSIDMTACMGCNACVVACQAENNIPVVGKQEVGRQREMHWIRIDDYFAGDIDAPKVHHQPVPCMQCENAPCEYVCPVGATTHSDEGLNEMTYNRCIGTRYCSNNCPYKVRRFNFLLFSDYETPTIKLLHNPDVTVRSRGVMEKCTYCVQRIDRTRIEMEREVLDLQEQARAATEPEQRDQLMQQAKTRGTEIVRRLQTACQQSCPTQAIIFGDKRDPGSQVAKLKKEPTDYTLLDSLTTKPRTSYLARIMNPNEALANSTTASATPSLGTPGEGRGGGDSREVPLADSATSTSRLSNDSSTRSAEPSAFPHGPYPIPLPGYQGRGQEALSALGKGGSA